MRDRELKNKTVSCAAALAAMGVLSACGGGGGGSSAGFGSYTSALNYVPVYASGPSDTVASSLSTKGASGTLVLNQAVSTSVVVTNARLRLSPDLKTAYLSIGGGAEIVMTNDPAFADPDAGGGI